MGIMRNLDVYVLMKFVTGQFHLALDVQMAVIVKIIMSETFIKENAFTIVIVLRRLMAK